MSGIKVTAADRVFSLAVRTRDGYTCQRCGQGFTPGNARGLHCAHIFGRGDKRLRTNMDNAVSLCYGCHRWFTAHPASFMEFVQKHIGTERFEELAEIHNRKRDRV